ncbi:MAG TPA: DUF296 domain-containing protein [Firmicutes bacterium]|jgi:hypothetical protein|nr:DUF296 domain-containing protein [Bacillota bacterium]
MRTFTGSGLGRVIVINLERGEKLLESIRNHLKEIGVENAILLSAIGSLQKVHFHRVLSLDEKPEDEFLVLEKPFEISAMQGIVASGEPHFHMVFSDLENTYSGHLEDETEVLYLVEITLVEIKDLRLVRNKDTKNTYIKLLEEI